ncbi:MAG TPA: response regulator [Puia sp.]|nr:response regulator [Puia sp.]
MRPKILLVDDRDDNLMSMESILSPDEYQFIKANSGREALKILLHEFDFALILMDVNMPNLNGLETAALIYEREKLRQIPIIFITAINYGEEYIFKAYRSGAVDYIFKPINPDLLRAKVSVYIDLYRKNQMLLAQEQKLLAINKTLELEIRERKTSEEKISELNRQLLENVSHLESVNKDMDFFIYMASHDLQEPVRKLRMMMDRFCLKYQDLLDQEGHNYLGRISEVAQRMQLLIKDILSLTRISEDENPFEETNLDNMISDILIDFQPIIQEKKVDIIVDKLPILKVNPVLFRLMFENLLSNALKFSKEKGERIIRVFSSLSLTENGMDNNGSQNGYYRLFVEDNGIGFDQQYASQIFEMFRRLHGTAEYKGTGIGLALCKRIAEKHQGFISARSKENEGTLFTISVPVYLSAPSENSAFAR